jgi:hypothetical protein
MRRTTRERAANRLSDNGQRPRARIAVKNEVENRRAAAATAMEARPLSPAFTTKRSPQAGADDVRDRCEPALHRVRRSKTLEGFDDRARVPTPLSDDPNSRATSEGTLERVRMRTTPQRPAGAQGGPDGTGLVMVRPWRLVPRYRAGEARPLRRHRLTRSPSGAMRGVARSFPRAHPNLSTTALGRRT